MDTQAPHRVLLVIISILLGIIVGLITGILAAINNSSTATAVTRGGIGFGGTVTLTVLIMNALGVV